MSKYTSIPVLRETKEQLAALGRKGETYNELIIRLLQQRGNNENAAQ